MLVLLPHHSNHLNNNGPIYLHPIWPFGGHAYLKDHLFFEVCHCDSKSLMFSVSVQKSYFDKGLFLRCTALPSQY